MMSILDTLEQSFVVVRTMKYYDDITATVPKAR